MKTTKSLILTAVFCLVLVSASFADGGDNASPTYKSLGIQLTEEVKAVVNSPVYLAYTDKNLKGEAIVTMKVNSDGKIVIVNVRGKNEFLNEYLSLKISSKNLWADTEFTDKYFRYKN